MNTIQANHYTIEIGNIEQLSFNKVLDENRNSKKIILVDENTHQHCLDVLITQFESLQDAEIILLPSGEENKTIEVCLQVWGALSEYKISRDDIIINLGGGVVTDMGGFIASVFKRGLRFIHIPTTLLAMIDASVGGKTGIDFDSYKNQLGVMANPIAVYIDKRFLSTLPKSEVNNGRAEMLKHGFIANQSHWEKVSSTKNKITNELIIDSIQIKHNIVTKDPFEQGERKLLNFGHTVGHALESYFLSKTKIAHGFAVAWGMIVESMMSKQLQMLNQKELDELSSVITRNFAPIVIQDKDIVPIFELMQQDKKNKQGKILCVLPSAIGKGEWDCLIEFDVFQSAMMSLIK